MTRARFLHLAREAIAAGLISEDEAKVICRYGTNKMRYWHRHVRDLETVIATRKSELEAKKQDKNSEM